MYYRYSLRVFDFYPWILHKENPHKGATNQTYCDNRLLAHLQNCLPLQLLHSRFPLVALWWNLRKKQIQHIHKYKSSINLCFFIYYNNNNYSWKLININNSNNNNMKKEKKKSLWSCAKEPGTPCKAQHHRYYSHKSNTLTIKRCPMYN